MTVIVKKRSGSMVVVIPLAMARELGLTEGTSLQVTSSEAAIVLCKKGKRPRRPISEIVAQIKPGSYANHNREFLDDRPVGKEFW